MAATPPDEVDRRRVRMGLALLTVVVIAALLILFLVDNPVAQILAMAVLLFTLLRTWFMVRARRFR